MIILAWLLVCVAQKNVVLPGVVHTYSDDQTDWAHLRYLDNQGPSTVVAFLSHRFLYTYPKLVVNGSFTRFALPAAAEADVAFGTVQKLYVLPRNTPGKMYVLACHLPSSCPMTIEKTLTYPVVPGCTWKHVMATNALVLRVLFMCDTHMLLFRCPSGVCTTAGKVFSLADLIPGSAYNGLSSVGWDPYTLPGWAFLFRQVDGKDHPGQILAISFSPSDDVILQTTTFIRDAPPFNLAFHVASAPFAWPSTANGTDLAFFERSGSQEMYRTIAIAVPPGQDFVAGSPVRQHTVSKAFIATASSTEVSIHFIDVKGGTEACPPYSHAGAPPRDLLATAVQGGIWEAWTASKTAGGLMLSSFNYDPPPVRFSRAGAPISPPAARTAAGNCTDSLMPPVCYESCTAGDAICGPRGGCSSGSACYVLSSNVDCCNYCPPEWSGACA